MTTPTSPTLTDAQLLLERFMLGLAVWREARGESAAGKLLVATVIVNRLHDPQNRWPKTIVGVVTQRLQFSAFNLGDPNALLFPRLNDPMWESCMAAADAALTETPITSANHYHTKQVVPSWADPTKFDREEGNHLFYRL